MRGFLISPPGTRIADIARIPRRTAGDGRADGNGAAGGDERTAEEG
jgi:hypothetical protein